jgi:hypothetical protein
VCEEIVAAQAAKESTFRVEDSLVLPKDKNLLPTSSKKKNKKGGLSMFLSGALDDTHKDVAPPPPTPKTEGPAWGGAIISKGRTSLREIQDEQSKIKVNQPTRCKDQVEDLSDGRSDGKILLWSRLALRKHPMEREARLLGLLLGHLPTFLGHRLGTFRSSRRFVNLNPPPLHNLSLLLNFILLLLFFFKYWEFIELIWT